MDMKIKVDITNKELDAIENLLICWNLCDKHKMLTDELDMFKATQNCPKCLKLNKKLRSKAIHAWSKMVHAYEISRYGKCSCGKK